MGTIQGPRYSRSGWSESAFCQGCHCHGRTGSRSTNPWIERVSSTNETVFALTELPRRLGVIGAGPIGAELAQTFARLGAEVYLLETEHGILPREDRDGADIVQEAMARDGVKLLCCGKELKLAKDPKGIRVQVESHGQGYDVLVDQVLVAVGRAPTSKGCG